MQHDKPNSWGNRNGTVYYVLGVYEGQPAVKVGITTQPLHRRAMQLGGTVLAAHPGRGADEAAAHAQFADSALGHEWFRVTPEILARVAAIGGVMEEPHPQREVSRDRSAGVRPITGFRLTAEEITAVDHLAEQRGVNRSDVIRDAIHRELKRAERAASRHGR